ncbi:ATP-binding protein [Herbidospora galbida]|uniref:ATP-binding protein n=1 Tax=Herbidospora galbida TaxID=2575442 RepID=UPI001485AC23|nr:ATP-binding protein [Herbidospora galbida]
MTSTPGSRDGSKDADFGGLALPAGVAEQMRRGVQGWVHFGAHQLQLGADGVRLTAHQVRRGAAQAARATPVVVLAGLSAAALAPVALAAAGVTLVGAAEVGVGALAGLGTNILSEMIVRGVDRWRGATGDLPSVEEVERELAAGIEKVLERGDEQAVQLREEIAAVLARAGAAEAALTQALELGEQRLYAYLITAFAEVEQDFAEFAFLLTGLEDAAVDIQRTLRHQDAEHRRLSAQMTIIRDEVTAIRAQTRPRRGKNTANAGKASPRWIGECPYPGLVTFNEDDSEIFHGRGAASAKLTATLAERLDGPGMLVVTGPSGAGKSSLLRAGLLHRVARGLMPGVPEAAHWPRLVMTPTADPLTELAVHLAAIAGLDAAELADTLATDPDCAPLVMRQAVIRHLSEHGRSVQQPERARLVVVVDQFEEIFTLRANTTGPLYPDQPGGTATGGDGDERREAFMSVLHAAAHTPAGPDGSPAGLVVLGVRGDFWDRCAAYPQLQDALEAGPFTIRPMEEPQLRQAITGPARAAGLHLEGGLAELILDELRAHGPMVAGTAPQIEEGVLPLLAQAMRAAWEKREGDRLTRHGYDDGGGIAHAVQISAEAVYAGLTSAQRGLARQVMQRMTVVLPDGQCVRRPVTRDELHASLAPEQVLQVDALVEAFIQRRLMVSGEGTAGLAHDVLLTAWPRLRTWLAEDQADRIMHSQVLQDADKWGLHGRDPSFLYRGSRLEDAQSAAERWRADPGRYPHWPHPMPSTPS